MKINIVNYFNSADYSPVIKNVLNHAKMIHNLSNYSINIILVDNEYIQNLNKTYRDKDYPTDVLTFNDGTDLNLGDVFINIDKVEEQRIEYNHSFDRELGFLVCHGLLHTLDYDHQTEAEEAEMVLRQEEILNRAKLYR